MTYIDYYLKSEVLEKRNNNSTEKDKLKTFLDNLINTPKIWVKWIEEGFIIQEIALRDENILKELSLKKTLCDDDKKPCLELFNKYVYFPKLVNTVKFDIDKLNELRTEIKQRIEFYSNEPNFIIPKSLLGISIVYSLITLLQIFPIVNYLSQLFPVVVVSTNFIHYIINRIIYFFT